MRETVVITGAGGMGVAVARRLGAGRHVVLADLRSDCLESEAQTLGRDGFDVTPVEVDVADRASVEKLASLTADLGAPLRTLVHTAGLSPAQAPVDRLRVVDVLGTEHVLDVFADLVVAGTVGVCIASMAGYMADLPGAHESLVRTVEPSDLLSVIPAEDLPGGGAYDYAKRVNQLRVEYHAVRWGRRGGRVVSISPGLIATPMGRLELDDKPEQVGAMVQMAPAGRIGTAEDVAAAVAWLASPEASFVTGCDLRVDGGAFAAVAALLAGANPLPAA